MHPPDSNILLSTAYLPPISWFKEVIQAESVFIEAFETYPKQTYRNRCKIMGANGVLPLSIPLSKVSGMKTRIKDMEIFYDEPWQRLHWRSIDAAYSNSPFYLYYKDELQIFFEKKYRFLLDYNMEILSVLNKQLGIKKSFDLTLEYMHDPEGILDLRNSISPKHQTKTATFTPYYQVFAEKHGFVKDLSIIDLLFNEGPAALSHLGNQ